MIKFSVDKKTLSVDQMTVLNSFEESLIIAIKQLLSLKEYDYLRVLLSLELIKREKCTIEITSNPTLQKTGSYSFIIDLINWIKQHIKWELLIPNNTLKIHLKIIQSSSIEDESINKIAIVLPIFNPIPSIDSFDKDFFDKENKLRNRYKEAAGAIFKSKDISIVDIGLGMDYKPGAGIDDTISECKHIKYRHYYD